MEVVRDSVDKMGVLKTGMTIVPGCLNVVVESRNGGSRRSPCARLRSRGTVIKVVIDNDRRLVFVSLRFVHRDETAKPRVDNVVTKNIVRHVPLHLELAGPGSRRIVVVKRIVDHGAMFGVSPLRRIPPDRNTRGRAVIDKVIPGSDVAGGAVLVLTSQFDSKVHIMNDVPFDQDPGAAVHVNTVGIFIVAVGPGCRAK